MRTTASALLALLLSVGSTGTLAGQATSHPRREVTLGVSFHDVSGRLGNAPAVEFGYRPPWVIFGAIRPDAGAMIAWDGAAFGFFGISLPLHLPGGAMLSPSLGVGAYGAGDRTDLGSVVEFRSGVRIGLPISGAYPIAVSFYHLSNAGLRHPNPGMEVVEVSYSVVR